MQTEDRSKGRLIIVSNRLPIVLKQDPEGKWRSEPGSGGLVTALAPVLRGSGGLWIGWPGVTETANLDLAGLLGDTVSDAGYALAPVVLSRRDVKRYYYGFANEILWPLFHDMQTRCNFDPGYWQVYRKVNRTFAAAVMAAANKNDHIWVHDYHLMGVGLELQERWPDVRVGYFLHIPFPSPDIFLKLPWRLEILNALLAYDLVGLQTRRDQRNFVDCIRLMRKDVVVQGSGKLVCAIVDGRQVRIGNFPISIDVDEFADRAGSAEVDRRVAEIQADLNTQSSRRNLLLGVDRLDYSKGIPERLKAFANVLERFPHLRETISLVQIVIPSRVRIPKYQDLKLDIERLVSAINGRYAQTDWVPIHYIFRSVDRTELVALYRAADIALITPLKDGMNLVAKEYCAANIAQDGVLILSEFAGAADQLQKEALIVNPFDVEKVAEAIATACGMPLKEKRRRMRALQRKVRRSDVFGWVDAFLNALLAPDPKTPQPLGDDRPAEDSARLHDRPGRQVWMPVVSLKRRSAGSVCGQSLPSGGPGQ